MVATQHGNSTHKHAKNKKNKTKKKTYVQLVYTWGSEIPAEKKKKTCFTNIKKHIDGRGLVNLL
jgi:hypothetical protein